MNADHVPTLERPFADGLLAVVVSPHAAGFPLAELAGFVCSHARGAEARRADPGPGLACWEIRAGERTLLLQAHEGVVYLRAGSPEAEGLLQELLPAVREFLALTPLQRGLRRAWRGLVWLAEGLTGSG